MSDKEAIGSALGKIPSGVGVLTTKSGDQESAMLASWFQQAAFDPPMVTVAVNKSRPIASLIDDSKKFCLSLFHTNQKNLFGHFARGFEPGVDPFEGINVKREECGCAILADSMAYLRCELVSVTDAGDHKLYLGKIIDGNILDDGNTMVHTRKNGFKY